LSLKCDELLSNFDFKRAPLRQGVPVVPTRAGAGHDHDDGGVAAAAAAAARGAHAVRLAGPVHDNVRVGGEVDDDEVRQVGARDARGGPLGRA